jgi:hypothetical protein
MGPSTQRPVLRRVPLHVVSAEALLVGVRQLLKKYRAISCCNGVRKMSDFCRVSRFCSRRDIGEAQFAILLECAHSSLWYRGALIRFTRHPPAVYAVYIPGPASCMRY